MEAKQILSLRPMLARYLHQFDSCFGRSEPVEHVRTYVAGQLSDLPRKSIEPIADAAGMPPRTLQQFLSRHAWDHEGMADILQQIVAQRHGHPCSIGVIDETGHPKKGDKTPGVQRQWCGNTGKIDNCLLTVHLGYAAGDFHCLLDGELFLPQGWSDDRRRCRQAGIPDAMVHRTKWEIALELRRRAVANGVRFEWLTFDEAYGQVPTFLFALDDLGQRYVAEVPPDFTGWLIRPAVLQKGQYRGAGSPRKFPRLKIKTASAVNVKNLCRYSPAMRDQAWETFHVKDGTKGPIVWEVKAAPFYLKRDGLPSLPHWLVIARNALDPSEVKYFVSNAPLGTPLEVLLHVAFSRWRVERCFQDEKSQLGLSHFEVRNHRSLRRHLILTAVSHLFLAETHVQWRGEKPAIDSLPSPHCRVRPGPQSLDDRASPSPLFDPYSGTHHNDPEANRQVAPVPQAPTSTTSIRTRHQPGCSALLHSR